jgi:hypothetical protein
VLCLALGVLLRMSVGNGFEQLARVQLSGETPLLALLCVQALLPAIRLTGTAAMVAYWLWLATFPALITVAWRNRGHCGMLVIAVGLMLNLAVVAANGGMPVFEIAARAVGRAGLLVIPAGDFVHVVGSAASRLFWLADVLPLPGPGPLRLVASPGDLLLYSGVVVFLAKAAPASAKLVRTA